MDKPWYILLAEKLWMLYPAPLNIGIGLIGKGICGIEENLPGAVGDIENWWDEWGGLILSVGGMVLTLWASSLFVGSPYVQVSVFIVLWLFLIYAYYRVKGIKLDEDAERPYLPSVEKGYGHPG